jgi:hypothetical protein
MRLNALYLMMGLLAMLAAPLAAGAEPAQPNNPETAGFQDVTQGDPCGRGWHWEEAGYAKHRKWRPAHCAPGEIAY